ncbi:glycosyltransferase family 4 protein [Myxococcota bacterium]
MATIVALITDAYGGFGGIAQYNRDFFSALIGYPSVDRVVLLPRVACPGPHDTPTGLVQRSDSLGGLKAYGMASIRMMEAEHPSVVVCGHVNLIPFAVPVALRHRVPLVLLVYGYEVWHPHRVATRLLMRFVDHVVSISRLTVDRMLRWCPALARCPVTLIPNAIDLDRFRPAQDKPAYLVERYRLNGKRALLSLGRLSAQERFKGTDELLELMPTLLESEPDITYLVAGDGDDLPRLRAKSASLGLSESVVFCGRVDESEKVAHYQVSDAFVMPSRAEGFGFVFLEAMAAGIPVVASILDGSREAVRLGTLGELCDPRDQPGTIAAVRRALAKGRGQVPPGLDYFSVPQFRKRAHDLLSQVLPSEVPAT